MRMWQLVACFLALWCLAAYVVAWVNAELFVYIAVGFFGA